MWPFDLGAGWKLVTYSIIPIVSQPSLGPALQLPTHTSKSLGANSCAVGPAGIVGVQPGNWSIFGLLDNVWSFAGSGDDINEMNFQYQAVYLFPKDWFFITNWTVVADRKADSDDRWTVLIGGGFGKQFQIGKHQYQAYGQIGYNIVRPDDTASWRAIIEITRVF